jgi:uncharacterized protein (DUF885 family)/uncharacterized membrane protein
MPTPTGAPLDGRLAAIDALTDEFWAWRLDNEWYFRLQTGEPVHRLPDFGIAEAERQASIAAGFLERIAPLSGAAVGTDAADTLGYLEAVAARVRTEAQHYWLLPVVTPYRLSDLSVMIDLAIRQFRFETGADVDRYLDLVYDLAGAIRSIAGKLAGQAARDIWLPAEAYPGAAATLQGFAQGLRNQLVPADRRVVELPVPDRGRLLDQTEALVSGPVAAAVRALDDALEQHRKRLSDRVGFHQYRGGLDAYADLIRIETTTELDADALHQIGHEDCRDIAERMRRVRGRMGFGGSEAEFHAKIEHEPRLYAGDTDEVAARFGRYIGRAEQCASDYFAVLPATPYGVARLDPTLEGGMTFGYHEPATRTRPVGLYRFNGSALATRSLLTAAAVIYHELIPGHHFHVARQAENAELHPLRRHRLFAGCAAAFAGCVLIGVAATGPGSRSGLGVALCLVAASAYAVAVVVQKPVLARVPPFQVTWIGCAAATIACLPFGPALVTEAAHAGAGAIGWMIYLGAAPAALGFATWAIALRRTSTGQMASLANLIPLIAIVLGWAVLGETPRRLAASGGVLCLAPGRPCPAAESARACRSRRARPSHPSYFGQTSAVTNRTAAAKSVTGGGEQAARDIPQPGSVFVTVGPLRARSAAPGGLAGSPATSTQRRAASDGRAVWSREIQERWVWAGPRI